MEDWPLIKTKEREKGASQKDICETGRGQSNLDGSEEDRPKGKRDDHHQGMAQSAL